MSEYRYYIATAGSPLTGWTEFFSVDEITGTKSLYESEKFAREELSNFKIKKSKNTNLYSTLETWYADSTKFSNEIGIEVYRGVRSGADQYFKGFASVSDMVHDKENAWFELLPKLDDDYRGILNDIDTEYDIKGVLTGQDVIFTELKSITAWTSDGGENWSAYDVFTPVGTPNPAITQAQDASAAEIQECYYNVGDIVTGDVFIFTVTNYANNGGIDPWIDIYRSGASRTTGPVQITANGEYCLTVSATFTNAYVTIFSSLVVTNLCDFTMDISYRKAESAASNQGMIWMDFVESFLTSYMVLTSFVGKVKSTFFNGDAVPTAGPATGYEVFGGSDFIISETELWCDAETNEYKISFADIMSDVKETMQVYWYIDESDNFRAEHFSWFERIFLESTGVVLTSSTYDKYRPFTDSQEFTFNKSLIANREQFTWPQFAAGETRSVDFQGADIIYDELETIANVLKHELARVTTDVEYVVDNVADASGDGYLFLDCDAVCTYTEVQNEVGKISTASGENVHFSWANLHEAYWTWGRMSQDGSMNGSATTFNTAVRFLEQSLTFGFQDTLGIYERIVTTQGDGFQFETVRNLDTDFLTIKLGYDPYA